MARRSIFSLKVDVTELLGQADTLQSFTPDVLAGRLISAINTTVDSAYEIGRKTMLAGINLDDGYVTRKMYVTHATAQKPVAEIVAPGGRKDLTSLSHYGKLQETKPNNWSNAAIEARKDFRGFGSWPGWTRRTGNRELGIAVDRKADGQSVSVVKGSRKRIGPAFSMPGKRDSDGNLLLFTHAPGTGNKGKIKALTGPSVYQLFRVAIPKFSEQTADELENAVLQEAGRLFKGYL